jgi:uncharacterized protein (TIGR03086 family)
MSGDVIDRHLRACDGFSFAVGNGTGRWDWPSPCTEWDARGVVEHVIGFHDVLLLRPLGAKPDRPKDDPMARWAVTVPAIASVLLGANDDLKVTVPDGPDMELARLVPMLTTDVLTHTWDLAKAVGAPVLADPDLCVDAYNVARRNIFSLQKSERFAPSVSVPEDADPVTKLVALLGRDPAWRAQGG